MAKKITNKEVAKQEPIETLAPTEIETNIEETVTPEEVVEPVKEEVSESVVENEKEAVAEEPAPIVVETPKVQKNIAHGYSYVWNGVGY